MMIVEPKTTQPVEPDEELVDLFSLTGRRVQKPFLSSGTLVQLWRSGQDPMVTCQALNANG